MSLRSNTLYAIIDRMFNTILYVFMQCTDFRTTEACASTELPRLVELIAQRLARLQSVCNALLGFLFAAQRHKSFTLQVQQVLLADKLR